MRRLAQLLQTLRIWVKRYRRHLATPRAKMVRKLTIQKASKSARVHWVTSIDQQLSEGPVAASDVDPSQTRRWLQPIKEDLTSEPAPDPHHLLIGGTVIEANFRLSHW
jgi:hypothetical protein